MWCEWKQSIVKLEKNTVGQPYIQLLEIISNKGLAKGVLYWVYLT
jgi:hypothetical protein